MKARTRSTLFDVIAELAEQRPFRVASLSERFGLSFEEDHSLANAYFRFYEARGAVKPPAEAITSVELRESVDAPKDGPVKGLLILEINPKSCLNQDEVRKRFGANPDLSIPSPHEPADSPLYLVYKKEFCKLSFGFSRREPSCLVTVTLDSIPNS